MKLGTQDVIILFSAGNGRAPDLSDYAHRKGISQSDLREFLAGASLQEIEELAQAYNERKNHTKKVELTEQALRLFQKRLQSFIGLLPPQRSAKTE